MKANEQVDYIARNFNKASGKMLTDVKIRETAETVNLEGVYMFRQKKKVITYVMEERPIKIRVILPKDSERPIEDFKLKVCGVQHYIRLKVYSRILGGIRTLLGRYSL